MVPDEFIFTEELCRLKRESRPQVLLTSKQRTYTWVSDDEFYQVHEYFEILISVICKIQMGIVIMWIDTHIWTEITCFFFKKILKTYSTKGKIWVTASIISCKKSFVYSRLILKNIHAKIYETFTLPRLALNKRFV